MMTTATIPGTATPVSSGLVDESGDVRFGYLDAPPVRMDLPRARIRSHGLPVPRPLSGLRLKQWQHFALVLPDCFVGLALVDVGYLRKSWCHVVDRVSGEQFEHDRGAPWLDLRVASQLWDDGCHVRARGYSINVRNHLEQGEHRLQVNIEGTGSLPAVHGELRCPHDLVAIEPLDVVLPVGGTNRAMYTHKVALPLEGSLELGGRVYEAAPDSGDCFALLDIHQAHYPRHTWWNWATCAGRAADGRAVALNLTRNVNPDDRTLNENVLWVDGALQRLGPASFSFDRQDVLRPWRLRTADGAVELTFEPRGERSEDLRLGVARSVFHQPFGTFSGTLRAGDAGEPLQVVDLFGVCEDHDAVW